MSKIEELAKEYCKNEHLKGSSFDGISMMKPAYIAGAFAVLREIDKVLECADYNSWSVLYKVMKSKIRELKGE